VVAVTAPEIGDAQITAMMAVKRRASSGYKIPELRRYRHSGMLSGPGLKLPKARRRLALTSVRTVVVFISAAMKTVDITSRFIET